MCLEAVKEWTLLKRRQKNKMEAEGNQSTIDLAFKDVWRLPANPFSPSKT